MNDPIVAEIRKHRMNILESYDWDFRKMSLDVMKRQLLRAAFGSLSPLRSDS
jgi:hypothetical protein